MDQKPVKRIRSLAQAEQILREWASVYDVGVRLDPDFNVTMMNPLAQLAYRAYLYIQRHEHKQQAVRETW